MRGISALMTLRITRNLDRRGRKWSVEKKWERSLLKKTNQNIKEKIKPPRKKEKKKQKQEKTPTKLSKGKEVSLLGLKGLKLNPQKYVFNIHRNYYTYFMGEKKLKTEKRLQNSVICQQHTPEITNSIPPLSKITGRKFLFSRDAK